MPVKGQFPKVINRREERNMIEFIWLGIGIIIGGSAVYIILRERILNFQKAVVRQVELEEEILQCKTKIAEYETLLRAERGFAEEKQKLISQTEKHLADAFKVLSAEALNQNNEAFLHLAKTRFENLQSGAQVDLNQRQQAIVELMEPVKKALEGFEQKVSQIEKAREGAYVSVTEQVKNLLMSQLRLEKETSNLAKAMRSPNVRGQWGELQLRRTVELSGMVNHVDFFEQTTLLTDEGKQRPDMIVHLPNGRKIIVDAKAPLSAYLEAIEASEPGAQLSKFKEYARHIRDHITKLGMKAYWKQIKPAPEFVILFIPGEVFFSAALEHDPTLIEHGVENQVILATPIILITLLKVIAYGWSQESVAEDARAISELGNALYERMGVFVGHLEDIRKGLDKAVVSYNRAVTSLETRVLPVARKFSEYKGIVSKPLNSLSVIEEAIVVPNGITAEVD